MARKNGGFTAKERGCESWPERWSCRGLRRVANSRSVEGCADLFELRDEIAGGKRGGPGPNDEGSLNARPGI
jgi:hypothetical protein